MMQTLERAGDLKGRRVLVRADFDVPVTDGRITETFRIERQKENLHYLLDRGARVTLAAHISAVPSFEPLVPQLAELLGVELNWLTSDGLVTLLENTRQNPGEKENDEAFARTLADGHDLYVNNAFAVCHRAHASVVAVAALLPAYAGLLVEQETTRLREAIDAPAAGKVIVMGGAKASTKVPVIRELIGKADHVLVGGVVANDVLVARGEDVGVSVVDTDVIELLRGMDVRDPRLDVPTDFVDTDSKHLDIGPATAQRYADAIVAAKMVVWNGPMGVFEDARYAAGTAAVASAVANAPLSIVGGGDTIAAIRGAGIALDRYAFVSTGGGAMLAFLAGEHLPGLVALNYYT